MPKLTTTQIEISTAVTKHDPTYNLEITYSQGSSAPTTIKISRPFSQWFDASGRFVAAPFQEMLASQVPVIGKAVSGKVPTVNSVKAAALQETVEGAASVATGAAVGDKTKRRKA